MRTKDGALIRPGMTVLTPVGRVVTVLSLDADGYATIEGDPNTVYLPNTTATLVTKLIYEVETSRVHAMDSLKAGHWEEAGMELIRLARRCGTLSEVSGLRVNMKSGTVCFHPYQPGDMVKNTVSKKVGIVKFYDPSRVWKVGVCVTSSGKAVMDTWHEDDCALIFEAS